jgi:hypothetical protein
VKQTEVRPLDTPPPAAARRITLAHERWTSPPERPARGLGDNNGPAKWGSADPIPRQPDNPSVSPRAAVRALTCENVGRVGRI